MTWNEGDAYTVPGEETGGATATGLWPEGNFPGVFKDFELVSSGKKGTPGIRLHFEVDGKGPVAIDCWITEASSEIAAQQLKICGWNGEYNGAAFNPPESVPLYVKHELYKNKMQERWAVSSFEAKPPPAPTDSALVRFAARYKQQQTKPAAAPSGKPAAPARPGAAAKPAANGSPAKPAPSKAPARAPAKPKAADGGATKHAAMIAAVNDQETAWAVWQTACGDDCGENFWAAADKVADEHSTSSDNLTPEQWGQVARAAPPF